VDQGLISEGYDKRPGPVIEGLIQLKGKGQGDAERNKPGVIKIVEEGKERRRGGSCAVCKQAGGVVGFGLMERGRLMISRPGID